MCLVSVFGTILFVACCYVASPFSVHLFLHILVPPVLFDRIFRTSGFDLCFVDLCSFFVADVFSSLWLYSLLVFLFLVLPPPLFVFGYAVDVASVFCDHLVALVRGDMW